MPIEIRELVIRIAIEKQMQRELVTPETLQLLKNDIVKDCVAKVVQKINKNRER